MLLFLISSFLFFLSSLFFFFHFDFVIVESRFSCMLGRKFFFLYLFFIFVFIFIILSQQSVALLEGQKRSLESELVDLKLATTSLVESDDDDTGQFIFFCPYLFIHLFCVYLKGGM